MGVTRGGGNPGGNPGTVTRGGGNPGTEVTRGRSPRFGSNAVIADAPRGEFRLQTGLRVLGQVAQPPSEPPFVVVCHLNRGSAPIPAVELLAQQHGTFVRLFWLIPNAQIPAACGRQPSPADRQPS